jgi:hypothetical protein
MNPDIIQHMHERYHTMQILFLYIYAEYKSSQKTTIQYKATQHYPADSLQSCTFTTHISSCRQNTSQTGSAQSDLKTKFSIMATVTYNTLKAGTEFW